MKKLNIRRLINFIEKSDSFSMHWTHWRDIDRGRYGANVKNTNKDCPACILGHLRVLEGYQPWDDSQTEGAFFGIFDKRAKDIVVPWYFQSGKPMRESLLCWKALPGGDDYITKNMALNMLDNLLLTGKVEWKKRGT